MLGGDANSRGTEIAVDNCDAIISTHLQPDLNMLWAREAISKHWPPPDYSTPQSMAVHKNHSVFTPFALSQSARTSSQSIKDRQVRLNGKDKVVMIVKHGQIHR